VPALALHNSPELRQYSDVPTTGPIADDQARALRRGYAACDSYIDAQIGRVLAELDRLGLRERTIVVLMGTLSSGRAWLVEQAHKLRGGDRVHQTLSAWDKTETRCDDYVYKLFIYNMLCLAERVGFVPDSLASITV
jgi:Sulfatase